MLWPKTAQHWPIHFLAGKHTWKGRYLRIHSFGKTGFYRSQQELYFGESFGAIIGYKGNGAIIHYAPPKTAHHL